MTQCCANFVELTCSEVPSSAPKSNNHFTHRTSGHWGQRGKLTFRAAGEVYAAPWNLKHTHAERAVTCSRAREIRKKGGDIKYGGARDARV